MRLVNIKNVGDSAPLSAFSNLTARQAKQAGCEIVGKRVFRRQPRIVTATVGDVTLLVPDGDHVAKPLQQGRWYESRLLDYLSRIHINPDRPALDIGAFFGNHATFFRTQLGFDQVIAYEPAGYGYSLLAANAESYGFTAIQAAVLPSDEVGLWLVEEPGPKGNLGMTRFYSGTEGIDTPTVSLAQLLLEHLPVLVKIDIEGSGPALFEDPECVAALESMGGALPHFVVEAATVDEQQRIDAVLCPLGYTRNPNNLAATPTFHWRPSSE